jgi:hypothetical protein
MQTEQKSESRKSKAAVANARVGLVDKETGEVIDEGSLIYVPKKVRIKGFFMGMQDGFEFLAKRKMGAEALNVLMLLIGRMDYQNVTRMTHKEIGEALTMKRQNVSRALKALHEAGVIEPGEHCALHLHSDYGWKGSVQNLRKQQAQDTKKANAHDAIIASAMWDERYAEISQLSKTSDSVAATTN